MPLKYIREAVVAVGDLDAAVAFHRQAYGFEVISYEGDQVLMGAPGASSGQVRLIATPRPDGWVEPTVFDQGPRLLGIYSRDLAATVTAVTLAGGAPRQPVTYPYGTASLSELVARGTDGVWWTVPLAVAGAHRPSDAYAADGERLHSELHTAVLVVDDHDAAVAFFSAGGLQTVFDGRMAGEPFDELVGMPSDAALRLAFMGGEDHLPARFEIMSFEGVAAEDRSGDPLGVQRLVFACEDVVATRAALVAAGAEVVDDETLRGPVGVLLTLVEDGQA